MSFLGSRLIGLLTAAAFAVGGIGFPVRATAQITAEKVRNSIDAGVDYLLSQQRPNGSWPERVLYPGGVTSLCTLALLTSGVEPDDPAIQNALKYLRRPEMGITPGSKVYSTSLQTMVFCMADPKADLNRIHQNVRWLEEQQIREGSPRDGCWAYAKNEGPGDNSNTQFALLALHEAERVGIPASRQTWVLSEEYFKRSQNLDGSWGYTINNPQATGSMTCAGIAALVITADKLHPSDATIEGEAIACCGNQQGNSEIDKALKWLGRAFSVERNPGAGQHELYYLYGLERVGRLTHQRFIGEHDWYREGAEYLVRIQDNISGFWKGGPSEGEPILATSFALLFLAKGRRPVLAGKLQHEPLDDWNHHRQDLSNLTEEVERRWKQELTWQTVDLKKANSDDLIQSPVLFLSGRLDPEISDEQAKQLRAYIDNGGFLLAESCCDGEDFDKAFRELMVRVFPEPEYKMRLLPPDHPVWFAEKPISADYLRPLWGIDVGCRTSVIYCPGNLGCHWELARPRLIEDYPAAARGQVESSLDLGVNIMAYATGREVKPKLHADLLAGAKPMDNDLDRTKLLVGKLKHDGSWDAAPSALGQLLRALSDQVTLHVTAERRDLLPTEETLFQCHFLFMHGRSGFRFSEEERKRLRVFFDRGGMLLADSICSNEAFAQSFRDEMAAIFPEKKMETIGPGHELLTARFGGFDLRSVRRRVADAQGEAKSLKIIERNGPPELQALSLGDHLAVVFSPHDISCSLERAGGLECPGYVREDAARIGINVILYSLHK